MNWDDLRIVRAVAEEKTIRKAAQKLSIHHTTVLRRVDAFEKELGLRLFDRMPAGYEPTEESDDVIKLAFRIGDDVHDVERILLGRETCLSGTVRLGLPPLLANPFMMGVLNDFMARFPQVELEVLVSNEMTDLNKREADIVLRVTNNPPDYLVGRQLAIYHVAAYVSRDYLATHDFSPDSCNASWIGWDDCVPFPDWVKRSQFPHIPVRGRINSAVCQVNACLAGMGMSMMGCATGDSEPDLCRVPPGIPEPRYPMWILTHKDLLSTRRVRVLMQLLTEVMMARKDLIEGRCPIKESSEFVGYKILDKDVCESI